jgi:hypothetical protein
MSLTWLREPHPPFECLFWSKEQGVKIKEKFDLNENPDVAWLTTDNRQPPTPYLLLSKKFLIIKP